MGILNFFNRESNRKEKFTEYFKNNTFGSTESVSGEGSTMAETLIIREKLPELFKNFHIKTLIDAPCGDFNWMKHTDLSEVQQYVGLDIVSEIIESNNAAHKTEKISFKVADICKDLLPANDMILCRDCLVHLSFKDGLKAIRNIIQSDVKYLLITTFTQRKHNDDLADGIWRTLNMELPPYNFPKALYMLNEECAAGDNLFCDKSLGLYDIRGLKI